jgi:hypothetical protein
LNHFIFDYKNTQWTFLAVVLINPATSDCLSSVCALAQPFVQQRQIVVKIAGIFLPAYLIDSDCAAYPDLMK